MGVHRVVELTKIQEMVLYYCRTFFEENDQLPPYRLIKECFGWKSVNAVKDVMRILEKKGYVEKNEANRYKFKRV